jgi:hypothetical protein
VCSRSAPLFLIVSQKYAVRAAMATPEQNPPQVDLLRAC